MRSVVFCPGKPGRRLRCGFRTHRVADGSHVCLESVRLLPTTGGGAKLVNAALLFRLVVSTADLEELEPEALEERLMEFWRKFRSDRLPVLVNEFEGVVQAAPTPK